MWRLLEDWNGLAADVRMRRLTKIGNAFDEAMLLAGHILRPRIPLPAPAKKNNRRTREPKGRLDIPAVLNGSPGAKLVHYHLFKNAGTSVDEMLRQNFGSQWIEREFEGPHNRPNTDAVAQFLNERPDIIALSSHTAPAIRSASTAPPPRCSPSSSAPGTATRDGRPSRVA